jgi:hypothetical protein
MQKTGDIMLRYAYQKEMIADAKEMIQYHPLKANQDMNDLSGIPLGKSELIGDGGQCYAKQHVNKT